MGRRDTGTDDPRVKVRPGKGSRPRSKLRPDYSEAPTGQVIGIDRGRYSVVLPSKLTIQCIKARELGRGGVVIGDRVHLTGDMSGRQGSLARIVQILPREHVLRRSLEEATEGRGEKIIVANADQLLIVTASVDPEPRVGMVERCLVAAKEAEIKPILCMTKSDLGSPQPFIDQFAGFDLTVVVTSSDDPNLSELQDILKDKFTVLVGHSGVGKSTLINALVPGADRPTGAVNQLTGKGRHTSTSALAFPLVEGGWVVDTPGVRSFGLSHADEQDVLSIFPGLAEASEYCLPLCDHRGTTDDCALDKWAAGELTLAATENDEATASTKSGTPAKASALAELVERARRLLVAVHKDSF